MRKSQLALMLHMAIMLPCRQSMCLLCKYVASFPQGTNVLFLSHGDTLPQKPQIIRGPAACAQSMTGMHKKI